MRYVSIDIETTGLDPQACQILEFGAVIDDLTGLDAEPTPVEKLPTFHAYIDNRHVTGGLGCLVNLPYVYGDPYALSMHPKILRRIATHEEGFTYLETKELPIEFMEWCRLHDIDEVIPAGKNYGPFDHQFLKLLPGWAEEVNMTHRSIDPSMLWITPEDEVPPSLSVCLERAGYDPNVAHTAVEDALDVVRVVREGLRRQWK